MKIAGKFVVSNVKESDRGQRIEFVDLEQGGQFSVSASDVHAEVKNGQLVQAELLVQPGVGKYGPYLKLLNGTFTKI